MSALSDLPAGQSIADANDEIRIDTFVIDVDSASAAVSPTMRVGDNLVEFVNGTNAQELRVYHTDDGAGNAEGFSLSYNGVNAELGSFGEGSGVGRDWRLLRSGQPHFTLKTAVTEVNKNLEFVGTTVGTTGRPAQGLYLTNLPTSDPNVAGQVWNDSGTLKISAG